MAAAGIGKRRHPRQGRLQKQRSGGSYIFLLPPDLNALIPASDLPRLPATHPTSGFKSWLSLLLAV